MAEIIALGLMLVGAIFTFIAALGVVRLPDLFMRMHANTKSATLGVGFIMLGAAVYFADVTVTVRALAVVLFLIITAPISLHLLPGDGRSGGYLLGLSSRSSWTAPGNISNARWRQP